MSLRPHYHMPFQYIHEDGIEACYEGMIDYYPNKAFVGWFSPGNDSAELLFVSGLHREASQKDYFLFCSGLLDSEHYERPLHEVLRDVPGSQLDYALLSIPAKLFNFPMYAEGELLDHHPLYRNSLSRFHSQLDLKHREIENSSLSTRMMDHLPMQMLFTGLEADYTVWSRRYADESRPLPRVHLMHKEPFFKER